MCAPPSTAYSSTELLLACLNCTHVHVAYELVRLLWILCVCAAEDPFQDIYNDQQLLSRLVLNQLQVYTTAKLIHSSRTHENRFYLMHDKRHWQYADILAHQLLF
jgi:hypothetical protein